MDHRPPNWTAHITPYLDLILKNMAFKWWTKLWLGIWRPYLSVSKSSKGQYRRSNLADGGPSERTLRYDAWINSCLPACILTMIAFDVFCKLRCYRISAQKWMENYFQTWLQNPFCSFFLACAVRTRPLHLPAPQFLRQSTPPFFFTTEQDEDKAQ